MVSLTAPVLSVADDILPDLITNPARLADNAFVNNIVPGRLHLRLSNGVPNIGFGEFRIVEGSTAGETQSVFQSIEQTSGPNRLVEAGTFVFHGSHNHFHVDDWAQYRVRQVLPGNGVGPILFEGVKTSFCLVDVFKFANIPGGPTSPQFLSCSNSEQGISSGWEDIYFKDLPDQWIDVTGITPGEYWIESEVDPENRFLESNENNNIARIKLVIGVGTLPEVDEIPLKPGLSWTVSIVLVLTGMGALHRIYGRNGGHS